MTATPMLLACVACLLDQARTVDRWSRSLTVAVVIAIVIHPAIPGPTSPALAVFAILVVLAGIVEAYFAIRVGFDAALFRQLADAPQPAAFGDLDQALSDLGLVPPVTRSRPAEVRIAGAKRLMRLQVAALTVQLLSVIGGAGAVLWW
jgi:hypothetical protein